MKQSHKNLLLIFGISSVVGHSFLVYTTFIMAWFSDMDVVVDINHFGEAYFEFFFFPVSVIVGVWTCYTLMKYYLETEGSNIETVEK